MPVDRNIDEEEYAQDDKENVAEALGAKRRFKEFDCPDCSANNPVDDTFGNDDDLTCSYCGQEVHATVNPEGRLRLKPV